MKKNVLILEDKEVIRIYLKQLVQETDSSVCVFTVGEIAQAYHLIMNRHIDLFLIDIILDTNDAGDTSGLKFVSQLRKIEQYFFTPVIFVTSLEDPALHSYSHLHCYGYIEKPFDPDEVKKLVSDALKFPCNQMEKKTLFFRKEGIYLAIEREKIVYAESINHVLHIHTTQKDVLKIPYFTLRKLVEEADSADIFQCSRNAVVNKAYVSHVDITNRFIQFRDGLGKVEIGLTYKNRMKEILTQQC